MALFSLLLDIRIQGQVQFESSAYLSLSLPLGHVLSLLLVLFLLGPALLPPIEVDDLLGLGLNLYQTPGTCGAVTPIFQYVQKCSLCNSLPPFPASTDLETIVLGLVKRPTKDYRDAIAHIIYGTSSFRCLSSVSWLNLRKDTNF
jgi:hypothetical protein